jgi:hypothetical protein
MHDTQVCFGNNLQMWSCENVKIPQIRQEYFSFLKLIPDWLDSCPDAT